MKGGGATFQKGTEGQGEESVWRTSTPRPGHKKPPGHEGPRCWRKPCVGHWTGHSVSLALKEQSQDWAAVATPPPGGLLEAAVSKTLLCPWKVTADKGQGPKTSLAGVVSMGTALLAPCPSDSSSCPLSGSFPHQGVGLPPVQFRGLGSTDIKSLLQHFYRSFRERPRAGLTRKAIWQSPLCGHLRHRMAGGAPTCPRGLERRAGHGAGPAQLHRADSG